MGEGQGSEEEEEEEVKPECHFGKIPALQVNEAPVIRPHQRPIGLFRFHRLTDEHSGVESRQLFAMIVVNVMGPTWFVTRTD